MTEAADPIAYTALANGTPVQSSDGQQFGTVAAVLTVKQVDVFDGIVVETAHGIRFVDADHVGAIFTTYVLTTLTAGEAAALPEPDESVTYRAKASGSVLDRLGRMLGRGPFKPER
jgi:uncharacterized protein YrrD